MISRSDCPKTPEPFLVMLNASFRAGWGGGGGWGVGGEENLKQLTDFTASAVWGSRQV